MTVKPKYLVYDIFSIVLICCVCRYFYLRDLSRPRHYVTSINGHVISDLVLTNPLFVTWQTEPYVTSNGILYHMVAVTNKLW